MLTDLKIKNFAIIDELHVSFGPGLSVITGETGAGKSIVIGAISLLLGDRASAEQIRTSEDSAEVEALFDISGQEALKKRIEEMGLGSGDELVVRRTVSRSGKNRVYINGSLATLSLLASLSGSLVNICSQHEHQAILDADSHIDILDEFAGLLDRRFEYESLYGEYRGLGARLAELQALRKKKVEREDLVRYQLREIQEAGVKPGEDKALLEEKAVLSNAQRLMEYAARSYEVLYEGEKSVLGGLKLALQDIREIKGIDSSLRVSPEELDPLFFLLEDAAVALREYAGRVVFDPQRLSEVDERLALLAGLKRKYGGSLDAVLRTGEALESELGGMSVVEEEISVVEKQASALKERLLEQARGLTEERRRAAGELKAAVEREIASLRMAEARFEALVSTPSAGDGSGEAVLTAKGQDCVEFYISTNVGEDLKPLNRVASGGELSRIILALKKVLAKTGSVGTIVFDEVDSGIGGAVAEVVGEKLKEVAEHHQVVCITHLPQIASFGGSHYLVAKSVSGARTNSRVRRLSESERIEEVARMLGGVDVTEKASEHAREMLKKAKRAKSDEAVGRKRGSRRGLSRGIEEC